MRRWLAIFLLMLLPLQFSWAAAVSYCAHESGPDPTHFGHHDHAVHGHGGHAADPGVAGTDDGLPSDGGNTDCGHCHGFSVGLLEVTSVPEQQLHESRPRAIGAPPPSELMPTQPERPQWARLA